MKEHTQAVTHNIEEQCRIFSRCDIMLINKLGGIGDILCARLLFEDLKQVPKIGQTVFAVPRKYLPLIEDHPYIDRKLAVEDLNPNSYNEYILVKDITQVPGEIERQTMPDVKQNRSDILANSIGLKLKSHQGHLTFSDQEMDWAQKYIDQLGAGKKIGIAPFTAHVSKDLDRQLVNNLVSWCRKKDIIPLIFHDGKTEIENAVIVDDLTLRQWMVLVSLLDGVVAAASAMFWISQLTYRPTIAIFGCEDLRIFGKYHLNLSPLQRRSANGNRLRYASITHKQEMPKRFQGDWLYCPCWDARKCAFQKWGKYPPPCLKSIKVEEITKRLEHLLNPPNFVDLFDEQYFMEKGCRGWYHKEAWGRSNEFHEAYSRFILQVIKPQTGQTMLDVGAAFGDLVYHLRTKGIDAHGVDISKYTVKNKHVLTLKWADVSKNLPFKSDVFDFVISRDCLEHVPERGLYKALSNIKRVLKPGGLAFLQIATNYCDKEINKRKDEISKDETHVSIRDSTWWKWMLKRVGLVEDIEVLQRAQSHPMTIKNCWEIFTFRKK